MISAPPSELTVPTLIDQQDRSGRVIKRTGDIVFSLTILTLGSPVLLLLAALVKLSSPGPVFYVQRRVGRVISAFRLHQVPHDAPDADAVLARVLAADPKLRHEYERDFKLKKDPRITWIGKFFVAQS